MKYPFTFELKFEHMPLAEIEGYATIDVFERGACPWRITGITVYGIGPEHRNCEAELPGMHYLYHTIARWLNREHKQEITDLWDEQRAAA